MTDMSSWRLKQSSSRAFFSLLPGCHSFSSELARVGKLGKSLKIYGKFRGNPHGGLECLDIDGDITLHRMFRMFRYLRLRMFGKFRNHWVFFHKPSSWAEALRNLLNSPRPKPFFKATWWSLQKLPKMETQTLLGSLFPKITCWQLDRSPIWMCCVSQWWYSQKSPISS